MTLCAVVAFDASARYKGDLNGDDRVDLADMVYLAKAIKSGSADKALDVNASGNVDDYDLHRLADIIISRALTEEGGLNVVIGGWDDTGEDYGGTLNAPALTTRSADQTRFYLRNPKSEGDGKYSMEFGISEGSDAPCAVFYNIRLPRELSFDRSKMVELENSISATHSLYGSPKFKRENEDDEWSEYSLSFIVMSPDLKGLPSAVGKLGKIFYTPGDCWGSPVFSNCQIALPESDGCVYLEEHWADYNGNFKPVEVSSVWFDQTEMNLIEGDEGWLVVYIAPGDATDKTLVWSSSNENVAVVSTSEDGRNATVKAIKEGEATVTATSSNGKTATCNVVVSAREIKMESIILDAEELALIIGDSHQFIATVYPEETTYPDLEWWVDDESVASIDQNGLVKMIAEGNTTVHVRSVKWQEIEATCRLNVTDAVDAIIDEDSPYDIYTPAGILIKKGIKPSEMDNLPPGLYIIHQKDKTTKLLK